MGGITARQIKKIHTLKSRLKLSDNEYRYILSDYWVNTSKDLTAEEAEDLIRRLQQKAISLGVWSDWRRRSRLRYEDTGRRPGMASPAQLRMIEAIWKEVSRAKTEFERKKTLQAFLRRIVGVNDMRDLETIHARKVIEALRTMKRSREVQGDL